MDHRPLFEAEKQGLPYLIIFIFEPEIIYYKDTSLRHLQFQYHSILSMNESFNNLNHKAQLLYGNATEIFNFLIINFNIQNIFSYQETGIKITYDRDLLLKDLFKSQHIKWQEYQKDGVIRGIKSRKKWDKSWYTNINIPTIKNYYKWQEYINFNHHFHIPNELKEQLEKYPAQFQPAGEINGKKYLYTFLSNRHFNYIKHISKPNESRISCARISPYLAWGNLTVKQVYELSNGFNKPISKRNLSNFLTRVKWRDHFIQKFEVECEYETQCINKGYESLEHPENLSFIEAWKRGETGFPLVDANMKCLIQTGWINFRMRAMLVSFLCHHLFQDWRNGVYFMAKQFLDYEPGIHYPQFQMQAGTTGINTIRIYNPTKQSKDHDPDGIFIKKWLPQLANVPTNFIHEPWLMTVMEQTIYRCKIGKDYNSPIIDLEVARKFSSENIWNHRKREDVKLENKRIQKTHTRRKNEIKNS